MKAALLIAAAVFFLLIFLSSRTNHPRRDDLEIPDHPSRPPRREPHEKNYFTNSYLHRNDEKHHRHKQNQTPW